MKILTIIITIIIFSYFYISVRKRLIKLTETLNENIYLKLELLRLDYETLSLEDTFKDYPNVEEYVLNIVDLIKDRDQDSFNLSKIHLRKPTLKSILSKEEADKTKKHKEEIDKINESDDENLKRFLLNCADVKNEIIKIRFPIKNRYYNRMTVIKLRILLFLVQIAFSIKIAMDICEELIVRIKNKDKFPMDPELI